MELIRSDNTLKQQMHLLVCMQISLADIKEIQCRTFLHLSAFQNTSILRNNDISHHFQSLKKFILPQLHFICSKDRKEDQLISITKERQKGRQRDEK